MDTTATAMTAKTDPTSLIRALDADTIRQRLRAIANERRSLLVLLRAALAARKKSGVS